MPTLLCNTHDLDLKPSKALDTDQGKCFVVRENQNYYAYLNKCPHQLRRLDWENEQFLDYDQELIRCASHGALFSMSTGLCVEGPCVGASLSPLDIYIEDSCIYLADSLNISNNNRNRS